VAEWADNDYKAYDPPGMSDGADRVEAEAAADAPWLRDAAFLAAATQAVCGLTMQRVGSVRTAARALLASGDPVYEASAATKPLPPALGTEQLPLDDRPARELAREACADIHTQCAAVGSVAADMAMKLLVRQYMLPDNLFLQDGVNFNSAVFAV
jgi:hypothetical protein